jgi:pyruvate/2-oxoglutarate/acetoin dehydrogenase E1 component
VSRTITYADAIREATEQEMLRDPSVFVYGIGVVDRFGPDRVFDTPLSEDAMTGFGIGAALAGMRPVHVHIRMDFLMLAMNQLINLAAKYRYSTGGAIGVPMVVRAVIGKSWGQGPQHSQGLHALFMHIPGLRVVAPSTPYDAKGLLAASIRDDDPVMFIEHRLLHPVQGEVPEEPYTLPFGRARTLARGDEVTLVGVSYYALECLRARHLLAEQGISAEVIDPVTLSPLDVDTIAASVRRTGHLVVVDCGWTAAGASAEIVSRVVEATQCDCQVRVARMGFAPTVCPTTPTLEDSFYPNAGTIAETTHRLLRPSAERWTPDASRAPELAAFRGPF